MHRPVLYGKVLLLAAILNVLLGATASAQFSMGVVSPGDIAASPGGFARIPVTLSLRPGISVDSLSFGFRLDANGGAPAIAGRLTFQQDAALPPPGLVDNSFSANTISVFFANLNRNVSGTVPVGYVIATLPSTALAGQTYTASITGASGSFGSASVPLGPGVPALVSVNAGYLVSDVFPVTSDVIGAFGDGNVNTLDLLYTLRVVTNIPGFNPAPCSDLFDALDSFPVDTAGRRGGDGILNTLDLAETLKRVAGTDSSRPTRPSLGLTCPAAAPVVAAAMHIEPSRENLWFGDTEQLGAGLVRVPVYMRAGRIVGLSFAVGINGPGGPLRFVADEVPAPSMQDNGVEGTLAVAWLEGFETTGGDVLLGYVQVQVSGTDPPLTLRFFGIDRITQRGPTPE